ncbi:cytochrome-c oxidase, cbb3-type subunit II [Helicobacter monodelphidis]|uniref:cytochrome-c oxidase, cbb3-type subunit II n=1 Tax=Helicobacter sp. 15-1451 TaxID=2004995 RepID=UPI000DCBEC19|nr:cytochrome-c oxidase, cbb3-type subunit II [Helicobacter sp. 15-1451]RAX56873.1 cytochrome-c oxidase, cbb3-type subunit II [Helicobacter sp. 15-1451]
MFHFLEKNPFFFTVAVLVLFSIAGLVEILPDFAKASKPIEGLKPHTMLEVAGRQVYIKESCNACHSQLIRPFKSETDRYGKVSYSGEYAYDRPFLWGSKRTGPDLHRVGDYRTTDWHEHHMWEPAKTVEGSIMPAYKHLFVKMVDKNTAYAEAYTNKVVFDVPYDRDDIPHSTKLGTLEEARASIVEEAKLIVADMKDQQVKDAVQRGEIPEIVALIAYLNSLNSARRPLPTE